MVSAISIHFLSSKIGEIKGRVARLEKLILIYRLTLISLKMGPHEKLQKSLEESVKQIKEEIKKIEEDVDYLIRVYPVLDTILLKIQKPDKKSFENIVKLPILNKIDKYENIEDDVDSNLITVFKEIYDQYDNYYYAIGKQISELGEFKKSFKIEKEEDDAITKSLEVWSIGCYDLSVFIIGKAVEGLIKKLINKKYARAYKKFAKIKDRKIVCSECGREKDGIRSMIRFLKNKKVLVGYKDLELESLWVARILGAHSPSTKEESDLLAKESLKKIREGIEFIGILTEDLNKP